MSAGQWVALALAALVTFGMVGAYNRLVSLRQAIGKAWLLVREVLSIRGEAANALVLALREPLAHEHGALDALLAAEAQLRSAADALGGRPVAGPLCAPLVAAEAVMASACARLLALLDLHADLGADPVVAPHAALLADTQPRLVFARQLFNDAAQAYDAAASQFPTRLLTRLFGFASAGRI